LRHIVQVAADNALYLAKLRGRNQVAFAAEATSEKEEE